MSSFSIAGVLAIVFSLAVTPASAETLKSCSGISDDAQRVACYDRVVGRSTDRPISESGASCEAALVAKLVSPSGYRLVDMSEVRMPVPVDEYVDQQLYAIRDRNLSTPNLADEERARLRQAEKNMRQTGKQPEKVVVTIVYDAPNRMNATIRGNEVCTSFELPPM